MKKEKIKNWFHFWFIWKPQWLRYEIIYLLGGIPKEHIGTLHYRNIESVIKDIKNKIENANFAFGIIGSFVV